MKELWIACMEEIMDELVDSGVPEHRAYDIAVSQADERLMDKLADQADYARMIAKEQNL